LSLVGNERRLFEMNRFEPIIPFCWITFYVVWVIAALFTKRTAEWTAWLARLVDLVSGRGGHVLGASCVPAEQETRERCRGSK
jgi:hypothetical protein